GSRSSTASSSASTRESAAAIIGPLQLQFRRRWFAAARQPKWRGCLLQRASRRLGLRGGGGRPQCIGGGSHKRSEAEGVAWAGRCGDCSAARPGGVAKEGN